MLKFKYIQVIHHLLFLMLSEGAGARYMLKFKYIEVLLNLLLSMVHERAGREGGSGG